MFCRFECFIESLVYDDWKCFFFIKFARKIDVAAAAATAAAASAAAAAAAAAAVAVGRGPQQ